MSTGFRSVILVIATLVVAAILCLSGFVVARWAWHILLGINPNLAVALVAAGATVLGTTVTVMLGRYFERKKEIEAHFRAEKIRIYDEFLAEFFKFVRPENEHNTARMAEFLREWQRKLVLWGGSNVLGAYFKWIGRLKAGSPDAQTIFLMDEFFRALRSDIGQKSTGLPRGIFANVLLRHGDFFLEQARKNPSITLAQLSSLEKERYGDDA